MNKYYECQGAYENRMKSEERQKKLQETRFKKIDIIDAKIHSVYMRLDNIENNCKEIIKKIDDYQEERKKIDEELNIKLQEILNRTTTEKVKGWIFS